jgi:hypothetical protein
MTVSFPDLWNDMAVQLHKSGYLESALAHCRRAHQMAPERSDILSNLGNMLRCNGKLVEAYGSLQRALELNPKNAPAKFNLGTWYLDHQEPAKAIAWFDAALENPGKHEIDWRYARSSAHLMNSQWLDGFRDYQIGLPRFNISIPQWKGERLGGRTLLVHGQEGYGDIIMLSRFLKHFPDKIEFAVPGPLQRLFGARQIGEEIEADFHVATTSLPWLLQRTKIDSPPYLAAKRRLHVRKPPGTKLSIGLVWKAKTSDREMTPEKLMHGRAKSMPFAPLLELLSIPAVALFSLQTGANDVAETESHGVVEDLAPRITDFADLASFIHEMDVIVSVDTAPAHLAGAMGKPVVVCLHHAGSWQWGTGDTTPWYDSATIVRQKQPGEWPIAEIVEECRKIAST